MIRPSTISSEAHAYISGRLSALEASEGIRILAAIESGSRAWGFPSADSDYDVRFIYARSRTDYLSVREFRDVIETPTLDDPVLGVPLDLNGWDIRKALRLGLMSNPVLLEWLSSPIQYLQDEQIRFELHSFTTATADRDHYYYHYDRLCRSAWNQMQTTEGSTVKRLCYALRPALMLAWLDKDIGLPPMDVHALCVGIGIDSQTLGRLAELIDKKALGGERDFIQVDGPLAELIRSQISVDIPRPPKIEIVEGQWLQAADQLFLKTVLL